MSEQFTAPSIAVFIDGSPNAVRAALWAVDEAISRDIALRLVACGTGTNERLAAALSAVRSAEPDVKTEAVVLSGEPAAALLAESRFAAMICLAAGSTAATVAASASCPVAVIRRPSDPAASWIVVDMDRSPDSATVLQSAVEEARLRSAPLRVLQTGPSEGPQLDPRLSEWRRQYPELDVLPVSVQGSTAAYLEHNAAKIDLVVVGADAADRLSEPLRSGDGWSVLVIDQQRLV